MNEEFIELTQYNTLPLYLRKSSIIGFFARDGMGLTRVLVAGNSVDVKESVEDIKALLNDTIYTSKG